MKYYLITLPQYTTVLHYLFPLYFDLRITRENVKLQPLHCDYVATRVFRRRNRHKFFRPMPIARVFGLRYVLIKTKGFSPMALSRVLMLIVYFGHSLDVAPSKTSFA